MPRSRYAEPTARPDLTVQTDAAAYDTYARHHPAAELQHQALWVSLVATMSEGEPLLFTACDASGDVVGAMPVVLRRRGMLRVAQSPVELFCPYGGPLAANDDDAARSLHAVETALRARGTDFLDLYTTTRAPLGDPLASCGFKAATKTTYLVDLAPGEKAVLASFASRCRRAIRKADKRGVVVRPGRPEDLDRYWEMAQATYTKSGQEPPFPRAFHARLLETDWSALAGLSTRFLVAEHEGRVIAAGVFPSWRGTMYYMDGVSSPEGYEHGANNAMQWHAMRDAMHEDVTRYDMVGGSIASIARFKESFGAHRVEYRHGAKALTAKGAVAARAYRALLPLKRAASFRLRRGG